VATSGQPVLQCSPTARESVHCWKCSRGECRRSTGSHRSQRRESSTEPQSADASCPRSSRLHSKSIRKLPTRSRNPPRQRRRPRRGVGNPRRRAAQSHSQRRQEGDPADRPQTDPRRMRANARLPGRLDGSRRGKGWRSIQAAGKRGYGQCGLVDCV